MRRMLGVALALVLLAAPFLASAQTFPIVGPSGTLVYSMASFSVTNKVTPTTIFKYIVPAGYTATASAVPLTGSSELYTESRSSTPIATAPQPLHLQMIGNLTTNQGIGSPGTFDIGVSFGGTSATIALANATTLPGSCTNVPVMLDVWISPIATASGTQTLSNSAVYLAGRMFLPPGTGQGPLCPTSGVFASQTVVNAAVLGSTNLASPTRLNVEWKWASASQQNSITWFNRILKIGN